MAEKVEHVLSQLLVPDNEVIQQATLELKELVKDPAITPVLCTVLTTSANPQVRQYAAVVLRRCVLKSKQWQSLSPDVTSNIRQNILQVLLQEPEKSVRKSLSQLVATVAKHELPAGRWPELLQFLQQYTRSQNPQEREMGMNVLSVVASSAAEQLRPHFMSLLELCAASLEDPDNIQVSYYTVQTITSLVPYLGTDEVKPVQTLVPKLMKVVNALIPVDQDQAAEAMEVFDELLESEVSVIVPHLKNIIEFCMQLGANKELDDGLRVKALSFVSGLIRLKRKSVLKLKLTEAVLGVLFTIMCEEPSAEDEEEEDYEDAEANTAPSFACQVIDVMALNLPPEKFIPPLMSHVEKALQSTDPNHRRAAYMTMAVSTEGCAEFIRSKLLQGLLQQVYGGLQDASPVVRNAALFALGQFSEHLQPDISKYSSELLPILFNCLGRAAEDVDKDPRGVTKTFYAVEMFCENLGKDILPYLPQLMQYLLGTLSTSHSFRAKELAVSAIGATANAAKEDLVPYFQQIIDLVKGYLAPTEEEGPQKVQTQALDTLGVLARTLGEHFRPLSTECLQLGLTLMADATDPDLRRCIYGLFAAISTLLKDEIAPHLAPMVKQMLESIKSSEGITAHIAEEETQMFQIFSTDDDEDVANGDDGEEGEAEGVEGFSVENAYLDEKEDACCALGELAVNTGAHFMPYLEECHKEVFEMLEYPASDVRRTAATTIGQFCIAVATVAKETNAVDAQTVLCGMVATVIPKFLTIVQEDSDRQVAMATLDAIEEMLKKIGELLLKCSGNLAEKILITVRDVLQQKVACLDQTEDAAGDEEGGEDSAEYDLMLMESAGDIVPAVAKAMGGEAFKPYFEALLPDLLKRLKASRPVPEQSFAIGVIAEALDAMGAAASHFVPTVYPFLMVTIRTEDDEVRSNSVYALGVLAAHGGPKMFANYANVLKELFDVLNKERNGRVLDNICAAVCRMIGAHVECVPLAQVLPIVVQCLPLKEDFEENSTVYKCLAELYQRNDAEVLKQLPAIISAAADVFGTDQVTPETQTLLIQLVQDAGHKYPDVLQQVAGSVSAEKAAKLQSCLATCNGS